MKTVVVAVDNSAIASKVIELATRQALALNAEVLVLCCVDETYCDFTVPLDFTAGEDAPDDLSNLDEQITAETVVRHALAQLQRAGVNARGRVIAGEAAESIVSQATALDAEMIIMGRRHLTPFNRFLKGSVSAAVIERAHCPVMVDVRSDTAHSLPGTER